jgi:hypothetical protein
MSAFNKSAAGMTNNVAGLFGMAATDVKAIRPGVVSGLKQSLGRSAGLTSAPAPTLAR